MVDVIAPASLGFTNQQATTTNTQQLSSSLQATVSVSQSQGTASQAVQASDTSSRSNVRERDAFNQPDQGRSQNESVRGIENLGFGNISSRVGFDFENKTLFVEILNENSQEVLQRFPAESLQVYLENLTSRPKATSIRDFDSDFSI